MTPIAAMSKFRILAGDIKIAHTVFAMPFALLAAFVAADGAPGWDKIGLIVLCMVFARTAAMAANRLLDARIDAANPRTASRAIPSGKMTAGQMLGVVIGSGMLFVATTAGFLTHGNKWPLIFSIPALMAVVSYPLFKRFTRLCHYYLGLCLGLAPVCAAVAISGNPGVAPLLLGGAVMLWTGGFDILYACLDYESDIKNRVFSVPAKVGIGRALWIARGTHAVSASLIFCMPLVVDRFGWFFLSGAVLSGLLLIGEHLLVSEKDLSKMNTAFFTFNGIISATLCAAGIVDLYI